MGDLDAIPERPSSKPMRVREEIPDDLEGILEGIETDQEEVKLPDDYNTAAIGYDSPSGDGTDVSVEADVAAAVSVSDDVDQLMSKTAEGEEKKGFFKRLLESLFEEDEEEPEVIAADKADGAEDGAEGDKDGKGKKGKKDKKDKKKAKQKPAKGEKKEKKPKPKKEKKVKPPKEPEATKALPKKKILVVVAFCATLVAIVMLLKNVAIPQIELTNARVAYNREDYEKVYDLLTGKKLEGEDEIRYLRAVEALRMENHITSYESHILLGQEREAVNDLIEGVHQYELDQEYSAFDIITARLTRAYNKILDLLLSNYGISAGDASSIANEADDYTYTLRIEAVVDKKEFIDPNTEEGAAYYNKLYGFDIDEFNREQYGTVNGSSGSLDQGGQSGGALQDALPPEEEMRQ